MGISYIDDADAACTLVGTWTPQSDPSLYNGGQHFSNVAGDTVAWAFSGLTSGTTYSVAYTWGANSSWVLSAAWSLASGGNAASGTVNQQVAPVMNQWHSGTSGASKAFQVLGTITASGTTATLTLTVPAGGKWVIADAAAIGLASDFAPNPKTATTPGDWSTPGTWTPSGVPDGVTPVLIGVAVTVSDARAAGWSGFLTGSVPALRLTTGGSLTINAGGSLSLQGDLQQLANSTNVTLNGSGSGAGGSLTFKPPSGQQCAWSNVPGGAAFSGVFTANGIATSRCALATDLTGTGSGAGLPTYMNFGVGVNVGILTASYADFGNFGDSSHVGLLTTLNAAGSAAASVTNCTFAGCSYSASAGTSNAWDGNYTFQSNKFTGSSSSTTTTINGLFGSCFGLSFAQDRTSGTRLVDSCSFDAGCGLGSMRQCKFTNNLVQGRLGNLASAAMWPDSSYFNNNIFYWDLAGTSSNALTAWGPVRDCYLYDRSAGNPHYMSGGAAVTAGSVAGFIFEAGGVTGGTGDCIFPPSNAGTFSVTGCIVLPDAGGATSGKLVSNLQAGSCAVTVEHNTYCGTTGEHGLIGLDETGASYAGEVAACRANLCWSPSATTGNYIINSSGSGTKAVNAVTLSDYNATHNPTSGTCTYNTSTSQGSVRGYNGIKVSNASPYLNSQVGLHDIDITGGGGPNFADATRDLGSWGATQGGDGTAAGAIAIIAANLALIGQSGTGLLAWVRAGFRPQTSALRGASYPGDASTTDAAGNAWAGGATPDIGAMAFLTTDPVFPNSMACCTMP